MKAYPAYWWILLFAGVLLFMGGVFDLLYPVSAYVNIHILLGILLLVLGISHLLFFASAKTGDDPAKAADDPAKAANDMLSGRRIYLFTGIFDLVAGIILLACPGITLAVLPFLIGIWFFVRGLLMIGYAYVTRHTGKPLGWFLAGVMLILLFVLYLACRLFYPFFAVVAWAGAGLIVAGAFNIFLAVCLVWKKLHIRQ